MNRAIRCRYSNRRVLARIAVAENAVYEDLLGSGGARERFRVRRYPTYAVISHIPDKYNESTFRIARSTLVF